MEKVTQADVAKALNISRTTVARALNDTGYVESELKATIIKTSEEMGYKVNTIARTLAMRREWHVYCFLVSYDNTFAEHLAEGIGAAEREFAHYGIKLHIKRNSPTDPMKQVEAISETLQTKTVDAMIIAPMLVDEINEVLEKWAKKDLPIAALSLELQDKKCLFYVGNDHYEGGRIAADMLAKLMGKQGDILVVNAFNEYPSLASRYAGFIDKMNNFKDIKIIETHYIHSLEESYQATKDTLKTHNSIKGIYSNTDVIHIANAIKETSHQDISVVGNDLNEDIKTYISKGIIEATLHPRPYFQGYLVGKYMCIYLLKGQAPKQVNTYVGYDIVTETNLDVEQYFTIMTEQ